MYAAISRSEPAVPPGRDAGLQRVDGSVRIGFRAHGKTSMLADLYQRSPARVLLPRVPAGAPPEAVLLNTAGGLTGGDRMQVAVALDNDAEAVLTTQAAEKLYRAIDSDAQVRVALSAGPGATLEWLPQETIAFDGGRLRRRIEIDLAGDSRLLLAESLLLGRAARGERYLAGRLHDSWRLRRDGRLIWADAFRLSGDVPALSRAGALLDGAAALASLVYAGPEVERWRDRLRELPLPDGVRFGASALPGLLLVRLLAPLAAPLRAALGAVVACLRTEAFGRGQPLPKMWSC
jgi:urease accessory protein